MSNDLKVVLDGADLNLAGREVLSELFWEWLPGQSWAVLGPNGSGKTSFLRLVGGEVWPVDPASRTYATPGRSGHSPLEFRRKSVLVSAHSWETYLRRGWNLTGLEIVLSAWSRGVFLQEDPAPAQLEEARRAMAVLGVEDLAGRNMTRLSQGQGKRLLLARALAARPDFLLLDEALDGLDSRAREALFRELSRLSAQGLRLMAAAHRREDLPGGLTHALELQAGRVFWAGPLPERPAGVQESRTDAPARPPAAPPAGEGFLFRLEGVGVVREGRPAIQDIDWTMGPGESWAVLGPNGSGKSTLLRLLMGDLRPVTGGRISRFGGEDPASVRELRRRLGHFSPDFQALHYGAQDGLTTVLSGFQGAMGLRRPPTQAETEAARAWIGFFRASDLAERRVGEMSHGQLRRLLLARAVVHSPRVLLLDEPLEGLDRESRRDVMGLLDRLPGEGVDLVLVSHRPEDITGAVNRVAFLREGRLVWAGPREKAPEYRAGGSQDNGAAL